MSSTNHPVQDRDQDLQFLLDWDGRSFPGGPPFSTEPCNWSTQGPYLPRIALPTESIPKDLLLRYKLNSCTSTLLRRSGSLVKDTFVPWQRPLGTILVSPPKPALVEL